MSSVEVQGLSGFVPIGFRGLGFRGVGFRGLGNLGFRVWGSGV